MRGWTATKAEAAKEEQNRKIVDLYLKAWNTQQSIADITGVPQQTVADIVKNTENSVCGEFGKTFKPLLYNIWNLPKQDNDRKHFVDNMQNGKIAELHNSFKPLLCIHLQVFRRFVMGQNLPYYFPGMQGHNLKARHNEKTSCNRFQDIVPGPNLTARHNKKHRVIDSTINVQGHNLKAIQTLKK